MKKHKSGLAAEQRRIIREDLVRFTKEHASLLWCPPEAVVQEIRYWQQSSADWRTNPTKKDKELSFKYHKRICAACREEISSISDATFHHLQSGIPNVHGPENMVPLHKTLGCHEGLHNAPPGSFTAGSMTRKLKP
ncbi:MAG: hypothetical protein ABSH49_11570 [Bryobacteraceae bacterium]|jgi:hypothetical protein